MNKLMKHVLTDMLKSRTIIVYTIVLALLSFTIFNMETNHAKGIATLLNFMLFIVPLVCLIFSTIYVYNSVEFVELLVSQPLKRQSIWSSMFAGLAISVCVAFLLGMGVPVLIYAPTTAGMIVVLSGCILSVIFVAIALWAAVRIRDKAKGIGLVIMLWLYFALLFDAIVLFLLFQFADYPIEKAMIAVSMLNPIDIARILSLLQIDLSVMMGYTGAVFRNFFGTSIGMAITVLVLMAWVLIPAWSSLQHFKRKDL